MTYWRSYGSLREQFAALDPVALLKTIREVQEELLTFSNHEPGAAASTAQPEYFAAFATAWHSDYRAPKGRRKTVATHWWRTRPDPFAESWPLVEAWLAAPPDAHFDCLRSEQAAPFEHRARSAGRRRHRGFSRSLGHRRTGPSNVRRDFVGRVSPSSSYAQGSRALLPSPVHDPIDRRRLRQFKRESFRCVAPPALSASRRIRHEHSPGRA